MARAVARGGRGRTRADRRRGAETGAASRRAVLPRILATVPDDVGRVREARTGRGEGGGKVNWPDVLTALGVIAAILIPLMVMLRSIQSENRKAHEAINRNVREQIEGVNRNIDRIYQLLSALIGRGKGGDAGS